MKRRPNNDIVDLQQLSGILTENKSSNTLYQNRIDEALPLVAPILAGAAAAAKTLGPKLFQFLKKPKGVQKQGEPSLSKPVTPATTPAAPAPTPVPASAPAPAKSSNLELTVPTRNPGGSVGTDITGAAATSGRAPSMGQMLDKSAGPPGVTSTAKQQISSPPTGQAATNIPNFRAAGQLPQAPTTMQPRPVAPGASATPSGTSQQSIISKPVAASKPTVSTPKAVAAATALGTLAGAASDPDKTKELIDKIISSDTSKTNTKPEGQGQNTSSEYKPTPNSDAPATANTSTNSSSYNVKTGDTLGHIAQQYKTTVSNLIKDNPNLVDTESGKLKVIQPGQAINVSQTTDKDTNVWKDYDLDKLGTGSGKDVKESLKELKKLSGLIK